MDKKIKTIGQAAKEQLTEWKAKYGKVYSFVQSEDDGTRHITYVCQPTFEQVQYAFTFILDDVIKTGKTLLDDCRLGGSDLALKDATFKAGLCTKMVGFFKAKTVEEVKEV